MSKVPTKSAAKVVPKPSSKPTKAPATALKAPVASVPTAPQPKPAPPVPQKPTEIALKGAVDAFFNHTDSDLNKASKWPLLIDPTERFSAFARHRDTCYIQCLSKEDLQTNRVRLAILCAYFYGKTLVVDFMDNLELLELFKQACESVVSNLYEDVVNKRIDEKRYKDLIRDEDGDAYVEWKMRNAGGSYSVLFLSTKPELVDSLPYTIPFIMV